MKRYCITGGIGAGKSYVCRIMEEYGISIYDCDTAAKRLMNTSESLKQQLTELIGDEAYRDGILNKPAVAQFLLASETNKQAINAIVHPAVMADFQASGLQWMESAILYEAHLEGYVDGVVAVTAPTELRIQRIMKRDGISYDKAKEWIEKQASQEEVAQRADFVVVNDGEVRPRIEKLLEFFNIKANNNQQ